jgi:hypothetical protein
LKTKKKWYAFSEKELMILKQVAGGSDNLVQLKNNLSIEPNLLTYHLKKLQDKDVIGIKKCHYSAKERSESRKIVFIQDLKHALLLKNLFNKHSSVEWEKVLSGSGIEVLFQATSTPDSTWETVSHPTYWRYCKRFENLRIMTYSTGSYRVKDNFSTLLEFIEDYRAYILRKLVNCVPISDSRILWQKESEFLIQVPKGTVITQKGFKKAATSLLPTFRIGTATDFEVYLYSNTQQKIPIEETILHILLIDREDARYSTYSYLLLRKELHNIDEKSLIKKAEWYNLSDKISHLLKIVKGP